jgi:hypothetical protein
MQVRRPELIFGIGGIGAECLFVVNQGGVIVLYRLGLAARVIVVVSFGAAAK